MSEHDKEIYPFIEAAKKYYFLEDLKCEHLKERDHIINIEIFDKFRMYCDGKQYWEIAAHFGTSQGGAVENIKRARLKIVNYMKLFKKGLA